MSKVEYEIRSNERGFFVVESRPVYHLTKGALFDLHTIVAKDGSSVHPFDMERYEMYVFDTREECEELIKIKIALLCQK